MKTHPFLKVTHLYAHFHSRTGKLEALENIDFEISHGEFICVVGPSGCGKSTLLRMIAGLLTPTKGSIQLEGKVQSEPSRRIGLVFQQPTLLPWRSVHANITLPLEIGNADPREIQAQSDYLINLVGLNGFEHEYPAQLSGGMAQRAAIARALAQNPEMLLLDEPFGSLDALTRERMAAELLRIWQKHKRSVLMVTHNVEEAVLLADRILVMSARPGHIIDSVKVNLPRPREAALISTPQLQAITRHLREALQRGEK